MMTDFIFDELNVLKDRVKAAKSADTQGFDIDPGVFLDSVLDLLVMAYFYGYTEVASQFGLDKEPDAYDASDVINEKFDGKDYRDRIREYLESGTEYDIDRVLETDTGRVYEAAKYNAAVEAGATEKTWNCMMLPTSRDTHIYLDGTTIPIDGYFYSYKGGKTLYPRQWGIAEEDVNCLCTLTYSKA